MATHRFRSRSAAPDRGALVTGGEASSARAPMHRRCAGVALGCALAWSAQLQAAPVVQPIVRARHPHDPGAFTQGLELSGGELFESTGLEGRSQLRRVDRTTGEVLQARALAASEFGEGMAVVGSRIFQLTWQNGIAHVYDRTTFDEIERFQYEGEGWGLCYDGRRLIMSDGSDRLFFRDPATFELLGSVAVRDGGQPYARLNELECVAGEVFANVWLTHFLLRIDPATGSVLQRIDASGLPPPEPSENADVLNGIAFDGATGRFLLTGKLWPTLFEVEIPGTVTPTEAGVAPRPQMPASAFPPAASPSSASRSSATSRPISAAPSSARNQPSSSAPAGAASSGCGIARPGNARAGVLLGATAWILRRKRRRRAASGGDAAARVA